MSDPYGRVKGGRLTFKGGALATRKSIDKKTKKHKKNKDKVEDSDGGSHIVRAEGETAASDGSVAGGDDIYAIDAAKKKKYEELFPFEAKRFGYTPKSNFSSVEEALDDRVKKKADRYCK